MPPMTTKPQESTTAKTVAAIVKLVERVGFPAVLAGVLVWFGITRGDALIAEIKASNENQARALVVFEATVERFEDVVEELRRER